MTMEYPHTRIASVTRQALNFFLPFILILVIVLLAVGVRYPRLQRENAFLSEIHRQLVSIEYDLEDIIEPYYTKVETFEVHCNELVDALIELETTVDNACMVSNNFPYPNELVGLHQVTNALRRQVLVVQPEDTLENILSEQERAFLNEFLSDIIKLKEACAVEDVLHTVGALSGFKEAYRNFEEKWQLDAWRTPDGTTPFDLLK